MASFLAAMKELTNEANLIPNEKGALLQESTGKKLLDLYQKLVRGVDNIPRRIKHVVQTAKNANDPNIIVNLIVLMFQKRNCRGGEGERDIFYQMFIALYDYYPKTLQNIVFADLIGYYGYYKDYFNILEKIYSEKKYDELVNIILAQISQTFVTVLENDFEKDNHQNLLFKWIPREKSSLDRKIGKNINIRDNSYTLVEALNVIMTLGQDKKIPSTDNEWKNAKKNYRKNIQTIMSKIPVVEVHMCARDFSKINIGAIASRANLIYRKAFLNITKDSNVRSHDEDRVQFAEDYKIYAATKGLNGSQCYPHEILKKILSTGATEKEILVSMWNSLRKNTVYQLIEMMFRSHLRGDNIEKMIVNFVPVGDVSGSMDGIPMDVSIAMTIFFSDFTHLQINYLKKFATFLSEKQYEDETNLKDYNTTFKKFILDVVLSTDEAMIASFCSKIMSIDKSKYLTNIAISFTEIPRVFNFEGKTLMEKYRILKDNVGYTTNFQAVHEKLLSKCVSHNIPLENIPTLVVFTDGQFDQMNVSGDGNRSYCYNRQAPDWLSCHRTLMHLYLRNGYEGMPDIVYWNLRANTPGFQTNATHPGVQMVSGYSPSMMRSIMLGQSMDDAVGTIVVDGKKSSFKTSAATPWDTFLKTMNDPIYDNVRKVLHKSQEHLLVNYQFTSPSE